MQELASLFVALVTFSSTLAPNVGVHKLLSLDNPSQPPRVLAELDSNEAGTSATLESSDPRRLQVKQRLEAQRLERAQKIQALQERRQTNTSDRQEKREEFREKLAAIKDERKQEIVARIDENLAKLNSKWVAHWNSTLQRLADILTKVESRLEASSEDTASVESEIAEAKTAIDAAQAAVIAQSEKTYTVTLSDDSNLGQDVRTTINGFHNDIKNVKELVAAAKKATVEVVRMAKGLNGEEQSEN